MTERIEIENDNLSKLFGSFDANIKRIEAQFDARISTRDGAVLVDGKDAAACRALLEQLIALLEQGYEIDGARIDAGIELVKDGRADELLSLTKSVVYTTARGRQIGCKTVGQRDYVRAVKSHTLTFGVGPAGTGKTFLAVALAAAAFKAGEVEKIILTRPAKNWAFCRATSRKKSTRICGRCTTRWARCSASKRMSVCSSAAVSRSRRSHTCAAARWRGRSSFWTKRRTRPTSK